MGIRLNGEFVVMEAIRIGMNREIVMGVRTGIGTEYATFACEGGALYTEARYFDDYDRARRDLFERVLAALP